MGEVFSAFLADSEKQHEEETTEELQMLQRLVSAKLEAHAQKMEAEAFEDKSLPIVAVVDKVESYRIKVENAPSEEINKSIDDVFQGKFLDGLKNLVHTAVNELLGDTSAGEQEKTEFHVVFANNSLLRVNYYMYKYGFSSKGLRDKFKTALCYVIQLGVLDMKKVDPQVVLYELDKSIGTSEIQKATERLQEEEKFMQQLYKIINNLKVAASVVPESSTE